MICPSCGIQQPLGAECIYCHTPVGQKGGEDDVSLEPAPSAIDLMKAESPSTILPVEEASADPIRKDLEEQSRLIQEQEKQIQLQLSKMEEEKQKLLEIKLSHEKQLQEMKAMEEQKKAEKKASEIVQAVDKFKNILISSLPSVENRPILEYKGLIGAQVLIKTDLLENVISGLKDASGLRNSPYYENLKKGFQIGLSDLKIEASKLEANAVLGVTVKEQYLKDQVLILSFTGMATVCQIENET
ncbi:MAG: heavy metal-binding domain-containing protein [Nitrospirae bacterium]|nr:heavy metal-binding domain-containing protein [Nitrospirota bacterium]